MTPTIDLKSAHRSVRKFTDREVDDHTLTAIIAAAQCAATSHFVQAYPVFGMCLGWPAQDPPSKPRLPLEAVLFTDRYPQDHDADMLAAYDRTINHYFLNRDTNLKDETWTRQMADFMGRVFRPHMKAFLEKKGFFLK
jgi:hypothetical protein